MSKGFPVSPLLELVASVKKKEAEAEAEVTEKKELDQFIIHHADLRFESEQLKKEEEQLEQEDNDDEQGEEEEQVKDDDEDEYNDLLLLPEVVSWFDNISGKTMHIHGIQAMNVPLSTHGKRHQFHLCPMCLKPWTLDKIHQMSCLPCGHIFGMSCLKHWAEGRSAAKCPECNKGFLLESARLLYVTSLCIPANTHRVATSGQFPFSKRGFTMFKKYEIILRTDALKNRSRALKQRAGFLERRTDAMKRQTELLNRMAVVNKRADVLERQNEAVKRQTESLNKMTDEEEEQQAHAEKRAQVLRRKAVALGESADEYLRKADAFGKQAQALYQEAKSLRKIAASYLADRKFFIQSYKEFLGLHDNKTT